MSQPKQHENITPKNNPLIDMETQFNGLDPLDLLQTTDYINENLPKLTNAVQEGVLKGARDTITKFRSNEPLTKGDIIIFQLYCHLFEDPKTPVTGILTSETRKLMTKLDISGELNERESNLLNVIGEIERQINNIEKGLSSIRNQISFLKTAHKKIEI